MLPESPKTGGRIDHFGLAVRDPAAVAGLFEALLGVRPYKEETVEREGVRTYFIDAGGAKLELLEALGPGSPVAKFLEKRGEGLHHVAFEVEDIHAEMARLKALGFTPLADAPRSGADGKLIFFLHPGQTHGVLVEFCQIIPSLPEPLFVPFRGGRLAVYRAGDPARTTVLLLHGAAGSVALETALLLRRLEPHYHVLALDFTGHGASDDVPDEPLSLALFAENARAVLDHLGVGRAHVFGFSMGGAAAVMLARRYPDRVSRLALYATNLFWDVPLAEAMNARLDMDRLRSKYPEWVHDLMAAHGAGRWPGLYARLTAFIDTLPAGELTEADLQAVGHPTLVAAGDRDELFPLDLTLRLRHALPDSRLAVLPGGRHALRPADVHLLDSLLCTHFG